MKKEIESAKLLSSSMDILEEKFGKDKILDINSMNCIRGGDGEGDGGGNIIIPFPPVKR